MFTHEILYWRANDGTLSKTYHCAVNIEDGMVIHFEGTEQGHQLCTDAIEAFNDGTRDPHTYNTLPPSHCVRLSLEPLVPTLDGPVKPELAVVNILGLDYSVPQPVADQIAQLKNAVFSCSQNMVALRQQLDDCKNDNV